MSEKLVSLEAWHENVMDEQCSALRDKERLLRSIRRTRKSYQSEAESGAEKHAAVFYKALDELFVKFEGQIESINLPEPLPEPFCEDEYAECWLYAYEISDCGIALFLELDSDTYGNGESNCCILERFKLLEVPARFLTASDYAQSYGVALDVVQSQTAQRKISSAVQIGHQWYIPELTDLSSSDSCRTYYCSL